MMKLSRTRLGEQRECVDPDLDAEIGSWSGGVVGKHGRKLENERTKDEQATDHAERHG